MNHTKIEININIKLIKLTNTTSNDQINNNLAILPVKFE